MAQFTDKQMEGFNYITHRGPNKESLHLLHQTKSRIGRDMLELVFKDTKKDHTEKGFVPTVIIKPTDDESVLHVYIESIAPVFDDPNRIRFARTVILDKDFTVYPEGRRETLEWCDFAYLLLHIEYIVKGITQGFGTFAYWITAWCTMSEKDLPD